MTHKLIKMLSLGAICCLTACTEKFPYQDTTLSAEERAADLVSRLTIEEKAALMQNTSPAIERLGIKAYDWWNEALHGVGRAGVATVFPQTIGMAATFDDQLIHTVFTAVSDEARAKSAEASKAGGLKRYQGLTFWTPNVNIFRDPRWGRGQETYGEDPFLTSCLGVAVVKGLQGPDTSKYDKLHACAKHFAVHSGPEYNRHQFNAENIAPRDLHETYLPAFKALVQKADVKEVMCAYNRFEGEPCCGSGRLLIDILRNDWGYKHIVVSDCWAINDFWTQGNHETHPDATHASAAAVLSGTDLECGPNYQTIPNAVKQGLISEEQVDISVKRLLKARFELGEMDTDVAWNKIPYSVVDCDKHKALALDVARKSIVLLQNNNNALPIKKGLKIGLVGPNANDSVMQWGNYNGYPSHTVTLLEALNNNSDNQLVYVQGCDRTNEVKLESVFNRCSINGKQGFSAKYWNNSKMEGECVAETQNPTPFKLYTNGGTAFAAGVALRNFSAVYETIFEAEKTEDINFHFNATSTVRLIIDNDTVGKGRFLRNNHKLYTLKAEKGKKYNIKIEYSFYNNDQTATLVFDMGRNIPVDIKKEVEALKNVDVIVFSGGISPSLEGEEMPVNVEGFKGGDRTAIELPNIQRQMIKELKKLGKPLIFVNNSGSAIALNDESKLCDAIVQAWYPGQAGGTAIADVLLGRYNPSGKLPVTFHKSTSQLGDFEDYSMKGKTYRYMTEDPLFCFGHGLSYTTFDYGDCQLSTNELCKGDTLHIVVPVQNSGNVDGEEVVQVYLQRPDDSNGPTKTLRGFKRVAIAKGETQNVDIAISYNDFEWFDEKTNSLKPLSGKYNILYGGTSDDKGLKKTTIVIE